MGHASVPRSATGWAASTTAMSSVAARTGGRSVRPRPWLTKRGDRYGLLLLLLVFSYVMSALTTTKFAATVQSLLFIVTLLLALRTSRVHKRTMHVIMGITLVGSAAAIVLALGHATNVGLGIADIWTALILLLTVGVILRRVLTMPTVSLQSIFGAVSAYMIIGLMFASIYSAMSRLETGHFFATGSPADSRTFQYFSFTTLTTLGYGDFTAGTNAGRAVAVIEAMSGQIFLATLVARLVASYRAPRRNAAAQAASTGDDNAPPERAAGYRLAHLAPGFRPTPPTIGYGPAPADRPGDASPRRGNGARPRVARPPLVKWHRARRR